MEFAKFSGGYREEVQDEQGYRYGVKSKDYVFFGDVSINLLDKQSQYGSRYLTPAQFEGDRPNLAVGLRIDGDPADYHTVGIHKDDVEELVDRFHAYRCLLSDYQANEQGERQPLSESDRDQIEGYLVERGVDLAGIQ